jgi:cell shape-determining protein MreC
MDQNENNQIEYENKELENLLKYPNESKGVDYKSSEILAKDNTFSYKLIKHIIGFGNSGGGHIVIGYKEDQTKIPVADPTIFEDVGIEK